MKSQKGVLKHMLIQNCKNIIERYGIWKHI